MINFKRIFFSAKMADSRIFELSSIYIKYWWKPVFTGLRKLLREFSVISLTRLDR
jgi:hypothetical protein